MDSATARRSADCNRQGLSFRRRELVSPRLLMEAPAAAIFFASGGTMMFLATGVGKLLPVGSSFKAWGRQRPHRPGLPSEVGPAAIRSGRRRIAFLLERDAHHGYLPPDGDTLLRKRERGFEGTWRSDPLPLVHRTRAGRSERLRSDGWDCARCGVKTDA